MSVTVEDMEKVMASAAVEDAPKSFKHAIKWALFAVLAVVINGGLVTGIIELTKDTKVEEDAELATKSGQTIKVRSRLHLDCNLLFARHRRHLFKDAHPLTHPLSQLRWPRCRNTPHC